MRPYLKAVLFMSSAMLGIGIGAPALAAASEASTGVVEEVVVTAQKRSERAIDVPVSVATVDAKSLVQQNLVQLRDYYSRIPSLSVSGGGSEQRANGVALRGVTTGGGTAATVAFTIDDVPLTSSSPYAQSPLPDLDPSDLDRIEVLRGPQGTLYGASSLGGLIKYVTVSPQLNRFSGRVEVGANTIEGGGDGYSGRASVNLPILEDRVALKISGFSRTDAPYIDNVNPAQTKTNVNQNRSSGGRIALLIQPTDDVTFNLSVLHQQSRTFGSPALRVCPSCGPGAYATETNFKPFFGDFVLNIGPSSRSTDFTIYQAKADFDMKFAELTSITAYGEYKSQSNLDQTNIFRFLVPVYGAPAGSTVALLNADDMKKFTHEVRLASKPGGKLDWLVGVFYTREDVLVTQSLMVLPPSGAGQLAFIAPVPTHVTDKAAFADLTYHFTDRFDVQVGGRFSQNAQQTVSNTTIPAKSVPIFGPSSQQFGKSSDSSATWLVTPRYKFSPDLMSYLRIASGYRPGGPNLALPGIPARFDSDTVVSYELGLKGVLPAQHLSFDAAVFQIDWKDIQLLATDVATQFAYFTNGRTARSRGVEASGRWTPLEGLSIDGNVTVMDATLTANIPVPAGASPAFGVSGDRLPGSPKVSGTLSAQKTWDIGHGVSAFAGGTYAYVGDRLSQFSNVLPTPTANKAFGPRVKLPSYSTFDLQGGVSNADWSLNLYVRNVTDKRGVVEATTRGGTSSPTAVFLQPRTYGLALSRSF